MRQSKVTVGGCYRESYRGSLSPTLPPAPIRSQPDYLVVAIAYASFVVFGLQSALLGVGWSGTGPFEYIRGTFRLELDAVGALLISGTIGYFIISALSGRIVGTRPVAPILASAIALFGAGLFLFAMAPGWWAVVLSGLITGVAGGLLDATLNIYFAAHFKSRLLNWLHACFGLGATIGPLIMTANLSATGTWRAAYIAAAILQLLVVLAILATRSRWGTARSDSQLPSETAHPKGILRLPVVWVGIGVLLCYTGLEMTVGQWAYSLFTEARAIKPETAGAWISVYWGSFTASRILFGGLGDNIRASSILRWALAGAAVFCGFWCWRGGIGVAAMAGIGFCIAPIFALMIVSTQERLGPHRAPYAIGYQVAAASIGFGILPGMAGYLAKRAGLEALPLFALSLAIGMLVLHEVFVRIPVESRAN